MTRHGAKTRVGGGAGRALALAAAALSLAAGRASAASLSIRADPASVEVGEGVMLVLALQGADARAWPVIAFPKGATAQRQQHRNVFRREGANLYQAIEFPYVVGFSEAGTYKLGPATILSSRGKLTSGSVTVTVMAMGMRKDVVIEASIIPARAYVGQPVVATFTYGEARDDTRKVAERSLVVPFLREVDGVKAEDPERLVERWNEAIQTTRRGLAGHEVLRIDSPRTQVVARAERRRIGDTECSAWTVRLVLIPERPGLYDLGKATAQANVVTGYRRSRDPFGSIFDDDPFFGGSLLSSRTAVTRPATAESDPLSFEVLPLPEAGRPAGFSGAIGTYELSAEAKPLEVSLGGEPVMLTLTVTGEGNVETVPQPALASDADWRAGTVEQRQETGFEGGRLLGTKRFAIPLRPRSAGAKEIPTAEIEVFDPARGAYVTLRTSPITVNVTVPEDSGALETVALPEAARAKMRGREEAKEDIEDVETDVDASASDAAWLHRPGGILAFFALPLAAYAALEVVARRRRRLLADTALARRLSAARAARAALAALHAEMASLADADFAEAVAKALQGYLADRLDRPGGEIPPDEAERLLAGSGAHAGLAREAARLLREAGAARFGGGGVDREGLLRRAGDLVDEIERGGGA